MAAQFHITTRVLRGNRIELIAPDFAEGDAVHVIVTPDAPPPVRPSALDAIHGLRGRRVFADADAVDRFLREERDAWER